MENERRKVAVVVLLDAKEDIKEVTMREFIELLQKEHDMDEKIVLSEIEFSDI